MKAKVYVKYVECADCGRKIPVCNVHYINEKPYGYNCYRKQLVLIYKQWEDEKNAEYSAKCFAAMQVFQNKKSNSFHDSVCKQWSDCKKLTARQLECIIKGFTDQENINFWIIWQQLTNDEGLKRSIPAWVDSKIDNYADYVKNEAIINCLLWNPIYRKRGFHFFVDKECNPEKIFIMSNAELEENMEDEEVEIIKVVEGIRK